MNWLINHRSSGQIVVELILAFGLFALISPAMLTGYVASREGRAQQQQRYKATLLAQEAETAMRIVHQRGWVNIQNNGIFHPVIQNSTYALAVGDEQVIGFSREIQISDAHRSSQGILVSQGGVLDPSTKKVDITVSWSAPISSQVSKTLYLTRYQNNQAVIHTTEADFNLPGNQRSSVEVVNEAGGEVRLSALGPGYGNWCTPAIVEDVDLVGQGSARSVMATQFEVFVGTGGNASGQPFSYVTVSNAHPPVAQVAGEYTGKLKSNDVFGEPNYAYLATDTNNKEVVILNTATLDEIGYFDAPGPDDGQSVFVVGSVGYVITGNTLYSFDLSSKNDARAQLGSLTLAATGSSLYVLNGYAYVALDSSSIQMQIVNVSNPTSMSSISITTVNGAVGRDIMVAPDEQRAYLVTASSQSDPEFFILNLASKQTPSVVGSYETNGMDPKAVEMVLAGNRALLAGVGGEEYQVINIAQELSLVRCGGLNDDSGLYDITALVESDGDAYAYVTSGQANSELKIIEGGPGGAVAKTGWYESAIVDLGSSVAVNRIDVTEQQPADTSLRYQVAIATPVASDCQSASYSYLGPDGTANSFFDQGDALPLLTIVNGYTNPGQCLRYKAFFTADSSQQSTPALYDITFNYSP